MRRFFTRLTNTGGGGAGNTNRSSDRATGSDDIAHQEKVGLQTRPIAPAAVQGGDRVKALTARFEHLAASSDGQRSAYSGKPQTVSHSSGPKNGGGVQSTAANAVTTSTETTPVEFTRAQSKRQRSPLFDFNKPLPDIVSTSVQAPSSEETNVSASRRTNTVRPLGESATLINEDRALNSISLNLSTKSPQSTPSTTEQNGVSAQANEKFDNATESRNLNGAPTKSVAFAPSPKKPIRFSQPNLATDPMPEYAVDEVNNHLGSSGSGNFAKPTLASVARARTGSARASLQNEALPSTSTTNSIAMPAATRSSHLKQSSDVFGPSVSRTRGGTSLVRRNSSGGGNKRNETRFSIDRSTRPLASSNTNLVSYNPPHGGSANVQNSIPFVSHSVLSGHLRSASPQSYAGTGSSSGGGGGAAGVVTQDYLSNSRRSSWQGRHHSGASLNAMSAASSVRSFGAPSWSEMTQDDLVNNLGARERTRQEVLWEIVASEERYVQELEKTKALFIDRLLYSRSASDPKSPRSAHSDALASLEGRAKRSSVQAKQGRRRSALQETSSATLPIASRFTTNDLKQNGNVDVLRRPRIEVSQDDGALKDAVPPSTGEDADLKALKRWSKRNSKRHSSSTDFASSQVGYNLSDDEGLSITLPPALSSALEAIDKGIVEGHALLSEALRQRYDEQWPLVRSLADVFARFSTVFDHYREYVLHLERALDSLEEAALMERAMRGKRLRKDRLSTSVALGRAIASLDNAAGEQGECGLAIFLALPFQRLLKYPLLFQNLLFHTDASTFEFENTVKMVVDVERLVRSIEDEKSNKEERDKAIDAFARIEGVKDRALLRPKADRVLIEEIALYEENPRRAVSESNDPFSTSTTMTRDAGGEVGVGSTAMSTPSGVGSGNLRASIRNKRSYRRLSDLLTVSNNVVSGQDRLTKAPSMGSKRDIWIVRFSDVELRCQRVGVTALPLVSTAAIATNAHVGTAWDAQNAMTAADDHSSQPTAVPTDEERRMRDEFQRTRESKERMRALRNTTLRSKTRNLYKFIGVAKWKVSRERRPAADEMDFSDGLATALEEDEEEDEEEVVMQEDATDEDRDDDDSVSSQETDGGMLDAERYIRQSKLSFSYGGAHDQVEPRLRSFVTDNGRPSSSRSLQHHTAMLKRHSSGGAGGDSYAMSSTSLASKGMPLSRAVIVASRSRQDKFGSRLRQAESHQRRGPMPNVTSSSTNYDESIVESDNKVENGDHAKLADDADLTTSQTLQDETLVATAEKHDSDLQTLPTRPSFFGDHVYDSNYNLLGSLVETGIAR